MSIVSVHKSFFWIEPERYLSCCHEKRSTLEEGERQGIEWSKTIVLKLDIDFPGMPRLFGLLLTQANQFIAFEIETDHSQVLIAAKQNTSPHHLAEKSRRLT